MAKQFITVQLCKNCKEFGDHTQHRFENLLVCDNCNHFYSEAEKRFIKFCGFCRGECKGEHYISPSTEGY